MLPIRIFITEKVNIMVNQSIKLLTEPFIRWAKKCPVEAERGAKKIFELQETTEGGSAEAVSCQ